MQEALNDTESKKDYANFK